MGIVRAMTERVSHIAPRFARQISRRAFAAVLAGLVLTAAMPGSGEAARRVAVLMAQSGQDRAQEAKRRGLIQPVRGIFAAIGSQYRGRQLGASLSERGRDNWIYSVKWITPNRDVLVFTVNAGTAQILNVRGRGANAARK